MKRAQSRLQSSFDDITNSLGFADPKPRVLFSCQDDGSRHYEWQEHGWDAVVTERGSEYERISFHSDEEALFQPVSDLTFGMAVKFELANHDEDEDCRVKISAHQIETMGRVSPEWQRRLEDKWRETLRQHPLHEKNRGEIL